MLARQEGSKLMRYLALMILSAGVALNACGGDDGGGGGSPSSGGSGGSGGSNASGGSGGSGVGGSQAAGGSGGSGGSSASGGTNAGGSGGTSTGGSGTGGTEAGAGGQAGEENSGGEAGQPDPGNQECEIGEAQNPATPSSLDLFGAIAYYADGVELPAGTYRVELIDGCMKYAGNQDWTIHAYAQDAAQNLGWFLGSESGDEFVRLPGTVGYSTANGAFADFEDCVAANQALDPVEFDFDGGVLGIWLKDSAYSDNVAGLDGRNPVWKLTLLDACEE